jgi:hypothetical protein
MRFQFKTTYDHDRGLFRDPVQRFGYGGLLAELLLLVLAVRPQGMFGTVGRKKV